MHWLEKAAQQGLQVAQFALGLCYTEGDGVIKDNFQAVSWWRKAAERGMNIAQYNLARAYEQGKGTSQDLTQAIYWYRRGIKENSAEAYPEFFNALGTLYETGMGVPQNLNEARRLYKLAKKEGIDSFARANLKTFGKEGVPRHKLDLEPSEANHSCDTFILTSECWPVGQL